MRRMRQAVRRAATACRGGAFAASLRLHRSRSRCRGRVLCRISASMRDDTGERVDLYTFGHDHRWGTIHRGARTEAPAVRELRRLSRTTTTGSSERLKALGVETTKPHPLADEEGHVVRRSRRHAGAARRLAQGDARGKDSSRPLRAARAGQRRRAVALEGRHGAAAAAFAHPALQLRRAAIGARSIRTRWGCACPITPATSSPSCTARMPATIT